jgi:hypothetical protein
MQRVRIGLTGLAFVFLAVLLAAVFTRNPTRETPITSNLIEQQKSGAAGPSGAGPAAAAPADPLAVLGVAPGNADSNRTAAPAPPAAPAAR